MLHPDIKHFDMAVRILYATALGEDAALDDAAINRDLDEGRLAIVFRGKTPSWLSLVVPKQGFRKEAAKNGDLAGAKVFEVDLLTKEVRRATLPPQAI